MLVVAFYVFGLAIPHPPSVCSEIGPRLDGTYVTVCAGSVVRVRDELGNSQHWDRATNIVTVRSPGGATLVLAAPGAR